MILFFISFLAVFGSSYLLASVLDRQKSVCGLIYLFLIPFANVVFTFEFLSLFKGIYQWSVLCINFIILAVSVFVWYKFGRPAWYCELKKPLKIFFTALRRDKYLAVLFIGWLVFVFSALYLCSFMPVVNPDASSYHVVRSVFWVQYHSLNHFSAADSRMLLLPINSEILYAWVILFLKKQAWFGFFSFAGYLLSIISVYGIMGLIGFSARKKLWVIFILSSFASVIVQSSGTETDIIVAGLVSASMFLYFKAIKDGCCKVKIFMSALAYALAIGTKTPAILAIPAVTLGMLWLSFYYLKKDFYKPFLWFLGFGFINFIFFALYNYALNFFDYGNMFSTKYFSLVHENYYGIKAIPANFVKYFFLFFDFTGFRWGEFAGRYLMSARDSLISLMNLSYINDGIYTVKSTQFNQTLLEPLMGLGILGFMVYLPCWIISLIKPVFSSRKKTVFLFVFGLIFLINMIMMSYKLQFMTFSVRFLMFFAILSSPVLVYSYCKKNNPLKFIIVLFALFYLIFVSTSLWARPLMKIIKYYKLGATVRQVRTIASCSGFIRNPEKYPKILHTFPSYQAECRIRDYILKTGPQKRILMFPSSSEKLLMIELLNLNGYDINFASIEDLKEFDISQFDIIITQDNKQWVTNIVNYDKRKFDYRVVDEKIYLQRNKDNPCFYINDRFRIIDGNSKTTPYSAKCELGTNFFNKYNLELVHTIRTPRPYSVFNKKNEDKYVNYYFYKKRIKKEP